MSINPKKDKRIFGDLQKLYMFCTLCDSGTIHEKFANNLKSCFGVKKIEKSLRLYPQCIKKFRPRPRPRPI